MDTLIFVAHRIAVKLVTQATAGTGKGGFSRSHRKDLGYAKCHWRVGLQMQYNFIY